MARRRPRTPPSFAFEDNPSSKFGIIYADLLKSQRFQSLTGPAKLLYISCCVHSHTDECLKTLFNAVSELDRNLNLNTPLERVREVVWKNDFKFFVFPTVHYVRYGYDRKSFWKYKQELLEHGFISEAVRQTHLHRVTIYCFSRNWKIAGWEYKRPPGDFVKPFWTKDFSSRL